MHAFPPAPAWKLHPSALSLLGSRAQAVGGQGPGSQAEMGLGGGGQAAGVTAAWGFKSQLYFSLDEGENNISRNRNPG